jgi:hypothetical protein
MSDGINIEFSKRDMTIAIDNIERYADKQKELEGLVTRSTFRVGARARRSAPVKFGRLRQSINEKIRGLTGEITVNVDYAGAVEFGTKAHVIRPKRKKALAFKPGGGFRFWDESGRIVLKSVKHPGTKAQPYLTPAMEAEAEPFARSIKKLLEDVK